GGEHVDQIGAFQERPDQVTRQRLGHLVVVTAAERPPAQAAQQGLPVGAEHVGVGVVAPPTILAGAHQCLTHSVVAAVLVQVTVSPPPSSTPHAPARMNTPTMPAT